MREWLNGFVRRCVNAEATQMASWFRVYYFANQKAVDPAKREQIEALLARDTIDRVQVGVLVGLLMSASTPFALDRWRETLRYEYSLLLNRSVSEVEGSACRPDDENLRTEVAMLAAQVARLRTTRRSLSIMRNMICGLGLLLAIGYLIACVKWYSGRSGGTPLLSFGYGIAIMGGLGGLTSGLSRLYSIQWRGPALLMYTHVASLFWGLMLNLVLASFQGMVFALVLSAIFAGGLVEGALFPRLSATPTLVDNLASFFRPDGVGLTVADMGKALAWAFVAGFSERFVPDLMRQVTAQAREAGPVRPTGPADSTVGSPSHGGGMSG